MSLRQEITNKLLSLGMDIISFVDISHLPQEQNKGFPHAILFGISLSPDYLLKVSNTPDYIRKMKENNEIKKDEFYLKELRTDRMADNIADIVVKKGYSAYSQSEDNIDITGFYDNENLRTPLPHKTIAGLAGLGWIGKHNLLVTPEYGSAISMCTVLTDAPLETVAYEPMKPKCDGCSVCGDVCPTKAINGNTWNLNCSREDLVNVHSCTTCLKCMVLCPWTQKYITNSRISC